MVIEGVQEEESILIEEITDSKMKVSRKSNRDV